MSSLQLQNTTLSVTCQADGAGLAIRSPLWESLHIGPLTAGLVVNGEPLRITRRIAEPVNKELTITSEFGPLEIRLIQRLETVDNQTLRLHSEFINRSTRAVSLQSVQLLTLERQGRASLSQEKTSIRVFEQGSYWARVRHLGSSQERGSQSGEAGSQAAVRSASHLCWVGYDLASRMALAVGFETSERWLGQIAIEEGPEDYLSGWSVGFDGGDLFIEPGESLPLEEVLLLAGDDPWALLESYADLVAARHQIQVLPQSPVSWCSWYPYRLGVAEERVLANARIAAGRLKPLGLSIMEVDLGWERDYLPNAFEENDQFPHGLAGLAAQLQELGFKLGAWKAPFTISEHDPLARERPEWLLGSEAQKPLPQGQWFWEPHGETYALDLTHPEAQAWLRQRVRSLAQRGVRYMKPDFIGGVGDSRLRSRYNRHIVAGGGTEAARIGMKIIMEEMQSADPGALVLNCGGPELPGTGHFPLLYTCDDTGNTGYVGWRHLQQDYGQNVAGHLFKQRRWGIIQPSCLCVGLPGTLEEARVRATATFMSGGQVDISDNLTALPEDRWQVLYATLPPLGIPARPVDLFDPIPATSLSYEAMCRGDNRDDVAISESGGSRVWHLPVRSEWDCWDLIALFSFDMPPEDTQGKGQLITRFQLPFERLHLDPDAVYWAYEFWSGQFLGQVPALWQSPRGYVHPGDTQTLIATRTPGVLEVSFFGPAVKLIVLRKARPHPWVAGTSFHQSGGAELTNVTWDPQGILRGDLRRPQGHQGSIVIAGSPGLPTAALVRGQQVIPHTGANNALILPLLTTAGLTPWEVRWEQGGL